MTDIPHGTRSKYVNDKCRCVPCTAANAEYRIDLSDRLALRDASEIPHGTLSGYGAWRCRCPACAAAKSKSNAEYWQRRRRRRAAAGQ